MRDKVRKAILNFLPVLLVIGTVRMVIGLFWLVVNMIRFDQVWKVINEWYNFLDDDDQETIMQIVRRPMNEEDARRIMELVAG